MLGIRDSNVKVVTDQLRIYYDAGQLRSYSGSGVSIFNLAGISDTGTLTNGPTFNSSNGGSIVFDRTDDYLVSTSQSNINLSPSTGYTIGSWVYPEFTAADFTEQIAAPIAQRGNPTDQSDVHFRLALGYNSFGMGAIRGIVWGYDAFNSFGFIGTTNRWTNNAWNYIVTAHSGSSVKMWVNGSHIGTLTGRASYDRNNANHRYTVSVQTTNINNRYRGRMSITHAYNKQLTDAEVLQNYNAVKSRYI